MIVVTGTGRCGTGWMSRLLNVAGIYCGHEGVFTPEGRGPQGEFDADSSWMAVPHVTSDDHVILVYRDPAKVIASQLKNPFFDTTRPVVRKHLAFMVTHMGGLSPHDPKASFERFYIHWNLRALDVADVVFNIERPPFAHIARLAGISEESVLERAGGIPSDTNTRGPVDPVEVSDAVWEMYQRLEEAST